LQFLFSFQYQAQFDEAGAEQELCSIYIGRCNGPVRINRDEIVAWRWISPEALQAQLAEPSGEQFTPCYQVGVGADLARSPRGTALSEVGLDPGRRASGASVYGLWGLRC
jgi:isopentenyldiphosphate isomerase